MRYFKYILFLLLVPAVTGGQTAHVEEEKIVYKGTVKLDALDKEKMFERAKNALLSNVKGSRETILAEDNEKGMITAKGSIKLASPYHKIRSVEYVFELSAENGKYKYRIDSVYIKERERGGKTKKTSSGELLKGMDVSGESSAITEKLLNEIDMNFQKLLDLINADMKKSSLEKNSTRD